MPSVVSYYEKVDGETVCIDDEIPFKLPNGWGWCRLGTCCAKEIRRGKSPKYAESGDILVFAQKCNSKYNGIDLSLSLYLDETTIGKYPDDEYLQDKDIIINSTGTGTLGRVGIYREADNASHAKIVPDSHVTVIRAVCNLEPRFLFAVLKANQGMLEKLGEGSTNQKELKPISLKTMLIPIPPFPEQEWIVDIIARTATQIENIAAIII